MARFRNNDQQIVVDRLHRQGGLQIERVQRFDYTALLPEASHWSAWSFRLMLGGTRYIGYAGQSCTLAPNTICWSSPLVEPVRTRWLPGTGSDMVVISWSGAGWQSFLAQHPDFAERNARLLDGYPHQPVLALQPAPPHLLHLLRRLIGLAHLPNPSVLACENQCALLLEQLANLQFGLPAPSGDAERRQRVEAAQAQMVRDLSAPLSVATIAQELNVSPRQLQRDFLAYSGMTPIRYCNLMRLSEANFLLAETALPIATIAAMVGYNSVAHFSAAFRQIYQCSPRQVRLSLDAKGGG